MSGIHKLIITHEDGTVETYDCSCDLCNLWRKVATPENIAQLDAAMFGSLNDEEKTPT